ncbi:hypothetical protein THAOC_06969, partial [Thalassiosira oceanica]
CPGVGPGPSAGTGGASPRRRPRRTRTAPSPPPPRRRGPSASSPHRLVQHDRVAHVEEPQRPLCQRGYATGERHPDDQGRVGYQVTGLREDVPGVDLRVAGGKGDDGRQDGRQDRDGVGPHGRLGVAEEGRHGRHDPLEADLVGREEGDPVHCWS